MKKALSALLLIALAFQFGCSSLPSEAEAKKTIEDSVTKNSNGCLKLTSFTKTNGKKDKEVYSLLFDADAEVLMDCTTEESMMGSSPFNANPAQTGNKSALQTLFSMGSSTPVKKGTVLHYDGIIQYEKTEKGWIGEPSAAIKGK